MTGWVAVAVALGLDAAVGEPPERVHPVAWLGWLVAPFDREWTRPRLVGVFVAAVLPAAAAVLAGGVVLLAGTASGTVVALVAGVVLFATTSLRTLVTRAREVAAATETDLAAARSALRALAGRSADDLSAGQVRSAVVESLAENLADGLVAPLAAFVVASAVGRPLGPGTSLAAGAALAAWVKAVNTLDSMLGYRSKPVGWAPARLDDAVMWVPARITAALLALVWLAPTALARACEWRSRVPSPNAGWPMGTTAATLAVRLEKPGTYVLNPEAALPTTRDVERAIRRVGAAGLVAYAIAGVVTWT